MYVGVAVGVGVGGIISSCPTMMVPDASILISRKVSIARLCMDAIPASVSPSLTT